MALKERRRRRTLGGRFDGRFRACKHVGMRVCGPSRPRVVAITVLRARARLTVCAVIVIHTTTLERVAFRDDYDAFVEALRAEGLPALIYRPDEYRGGIEQPMLDLGIWVADN